MNDTRAAVGKLSDERNVAEALGAALKAIPGMDDITIRDTIEGETSLDEMLETVVVFLTETEVMIEGLSAKIKEFEGRKARFEERKSFLRAAVEQAMLIGHMKTKTYPDCTLTLADRAGGVVVTDESRIPAEFWKPQDPALDKRALAAALKEGRVIEGATLGNGGVSLTVRRA